MNMAMRQEPFESRVCLRFAKHHARLSSVISCLQSQKTSCLWVCKNVLPATWEGGCQYVRRPVMWCPLHTCSTSMYYC